MFRRLAAWRSLLERAFGALLRQWVKVRRKPTNLPSNVIAMNEAILPALFADALALLTQRGDSKIIRLRE